MRERMMRWTRLRKQLAVVLLDALLSIVSTWLAFSLRLDTLHEPSGAQWLVYGLAPMLAVPIFVRFGLHQAIFRYTGLGAMMAIVNAVAGFGVLLFAILAWQRWPGVPRSVGLIQPLVFVLLVAASRASARFWLQAAGLRRGGSAGRLLIYGAGEAGVQTAAAIATARQFVLVGFVDDDPAKVGRSINRHPVFPSDRIAALVERYEVTDILLALPSASRARRNAIIASLGEMPVHVRTLPGLSDLTSGRVTLRDFRELDVEDLLRREPLAAQTTQLARSIANLDVLVTGAGGSIGSELCRQLVLQQPRRLVLFDHNEFGLYNIQQELQALCQAKSITLDLVAVLGSVGNPRRIREVLEKFPPAWLYHAAAYKHVPMVESNAGEGIRNNVFGTLHVAQAAIAAGVANLVLVSTDKAVRPTNVMGASKRMAELVLQALSASPEGRSTRFSMVRFGNVLDSSGSVVPLFRAQIASGGPLTVTHPDVTRYFMTIPEAAQLVLHAGAMAQGGEVFVLDMGSPVKIMELAQHMVELSGLRVRDTAAPDGDIEITITGLRPGEKLYEELLIGDNPMPTAHPRIMKAQEEFLPWDALRLQLEALRKAADTGDVEGIKAVLSACVHGYVEAPNPGLQTLA